VDEYNTPAVSFTLNSEGVAKFSKVTAANVGRQLRHRPRRPGAGGAAHRRSDSWRGSRITGRFTQEEVTNLQLILKSGALPASLTYQQQEEVGRRSGRTQSVPASWRR
jgi:preprotein translocase subunit SecD